MVVVRNVFRLTFGKTRDALAIVKEGVATQRKIAAAAGLDFRFRVLTDVTGPFYTLVLEITVPSVAAFEEHAPKFMGDPGWHASYEKLQAYVDSGYREIFTLVED